MQELGHRVQGVNTWHAPTRHHPWEMMNRLTRKAYRLGSPLRPVYRDWAGANQAVLAACRTNAWDMLWLDKGLTIDPETLAEIKHRDGRTRVVGYSPDDMLARHNHSRQFLDSLAWYDAFFTTKSYNVKELMERGCRAVFFVDNAFDPSTHRPVTLTSREKKALGGGVGFIGSYEQERAASMRVLARAGIEIRVYGGNWIRRGRKRVPELKIEGKAMIAGDYAKVICAFDVNLHFLRKINRDQQTTRSIEIPACGKLMLAERTPEHLTLFEDGKEAVFFESDDELSDKTEFYLKNPALAKKIGQAGRERCLRSCYSNYHRIKHILKTVSQL